MSNEQQADQPQIDGQHQENEMSTTERMLRETINRLSRQLGVEKGFHTMATVEADFQSEETNKYKQKYEDCLVEIEELKEKIDRFERPTNEDGPEKEAGESPKKKSDDDEEKPKKANHKKNN